MGRVTLKDPGLLLRLYIAGNAPNSKVAMANLKTLCDRHFADDYELEIVDMLMHPKRALTDRIIVTPTLIKLAPLPVQRVIGNLADEHQVLRALGK